MWSLHDLQCTSLEMNLKLRGHKVKIEGHIVHYKYEF